MCRPHTTAPAGNWDVLVVKNKRQVNPRTVVGVLRGPQAGRNHDCDALGVAVSLMAPGWAPTVANGWGPRRYLSGGELLVLKVEALGRSASSADEIEREAQDGFPWSWTFSLTP